MKKLKKLLYFKKIYVRLCNKKTNSIEQTLIAYIKLKINHTATYDSNFDFEIYQVLEDVEFPIDIEYIIDFFEFLFNQTNNTSSNRGVVFTPKYIADFMVQNALSNLTEWNGKIKIIDPGCGCGIFLISALEYLHTRFHVDIADLIKNHLITKMPTTKNNAVFYNYRIVFENFDFDYYRIILMETRVREHKNKGVE